jgi:AcrR family transcriptional regulator
MTSSVHSGRMRRVPQQSRSRRRVESILDAAARAVVERGVDAVGTRLIAQEAGVPVASLYQYFADKDEILLALVERDVEEMDRRLAERLPASGTTVGELVETTMATFVEVYLERPAFVMIWLRGRANPAIRAFGRAHNKDVAAALLDLARRLGVVDPDTPRVAAELAVEVGDRIFQLAFEESLTGDPAVLAEGPTILTRYLELYARPRDEA